MYILKNNEKAFISEKDFIKEIDNYFLSIKNSKFINSNYQLFDFIDSDLFSKEEVLKNLFLCKEHYNIIQNYNDNYLLISKEYKKIQNIVNKLKVKNINFSDFLYSLSTEITYNIIELDAVDKIKNIVIDGSWCHKLKDLSYEDVKNSLDNTIKTKEGQRKIKKLFSKNNYGISALGASLFNKDFNVFKYILNLYKELQLDLNNFIYFTENKTSTFDSQGKKERINVYKNQSLYDTALSLQKIKTAQLLEENKMNKSKILPFEKGGILYEKISSPSYLKKYNDDDIEYFSTLANFIIENIGIDNFFFNLKEINTRNYLKNINISDYFFNIDFLYSSEAVFNNEKGQKLFFDFLLGKLENEKTLDPTKIQIIKDLNENILKTYKNNTLKPEILNNFLVNFNKIPKTVNTEKILNQDLITSLYQKSLLDYQFKDLKEKEVKKTKFKL